MKVNYRTDIEWLVRCGASALGERGISGAQLEMLKNGISTAGGIPNTHPISDRQVGWSEDEHAPEGTIQRARRCFEAWFRLTNWSQQVLLGRYESRQWPPGVLGILAELSGVVIVMVGSKRAADRVAKASAALETELAKDHWTEAIPELEASTQPSIIPSDWDAVVRHCQATGPGMRERAKQRGEWLREAANALEIAHLEWDGVIDAQAQEWVA